MLSKTLKKLRERKGITQAELADVLGVTQQAVAKWERDKSEPDSATLKKLSKYFAVSIDYILGNEKNSSPKFNDDETKLIEGYRELDSSKKSLIMSLIGEFNFNHTSAEMTV